MSDIRKILVPVTFSEFSEELIGYAIDVARPLSAEVVFVNVIDQKHIQALQTIASFGYEVDETQYIQEVEKQRIGILEERLSRINYPDEKMRIVFKRGRPAAVLLKFAIDERVDLIIMEVKGKSEILHALSGSIAEKIFRYSPVPVLSYRRKEIADKLLQRIHV
ncbi:universal stress protein [Desulfobacter postgatei]|uniref:Universal stress protein UspA-like protein n=1 Tax=Desulfobacter postgatei 2ac9 TaxID=879212 RepID=I5B0K8_9BACT|nr:universal stress protein [Desulfobacter postgatei]EIM63021.1 universal stress protein UspA-like protein [Desulfobacter postgatei 2ac9]